MFKRIFLVCSFFIFCILVSCTDLFSTVTYDKTTIFFHANGGSGEMSNQEIYQRTNSQIKKNTFSNGKFLFVGWATSADGEIIYLDEDPFCYTTTTKLNLYAKWLDLDYFMVPVPGAYVIGSGKKGVFVDGRKVNVADYSISRYEIPYEMWTSVAEWATKNGYKFNGKATKGGRKPGGAAPNPDGPVYQPVSNVTWQDCIVWCNAYSEKHGLEPVYTSGGKILKDSTLAVSDHPDLDMTKNGYRLPTEIEWEFAARGGDPADTTNWNYIYPGTDIPEQAGWFSGNSSISNEFQTHTIGTAKRGTRQNIFDMAGNVREWCWDFYSNNTDGKISADTPLTGVTADKAMNTGNAYWHIRRGGSYDHEEQEMQITDRSFMISTTYIHCTGFRIARTGLVIIDTEDEPDI